MALDPVKNFAKVTVSIGYDASATSIALTAGHGARLPAPSTDGSFNLVWWNVTDYSDPTDDPNVEIVRCTARSTDTLTVTRAQESTSASTKNTSSKTYKMILAPTAKMITDITSGTETFSNKTIDTAAPNTIKVNGNALSATAGTATVTIPNSTDTLVGRATTDTLTNKTLTAPIIATISNTGTLTLPTSTDTLVGKATTDTLTNKRITSRVQSVSDAATITPNVDSDDCVDITAIAQAFTIANPTGTPTNFQKLIVRIKDNGTARGITFGSNYVAGGVSLPTTTVLSKILTLGFIYNTANTLNKWQLVASAQEA